MTLRLRLRIQGGEIWKTSITTFIIIPSVFSTLRIQLQIQGEEI
jgi:hypothetical protein